MYRGEYTGHEAQPLVQLNLGIQVRDLESMVLVDQGRGRQGAGEELEGWSRSAGVKALES